MTILTKVNLASGADVVGADNLFEAFTKVNDNIDLAYLFNNAEIAIDGKLVYPYALPQTYTYVGTSEQIATISCGIVGTTWTQTFTYGANGITSISCTDGTDTWIKTIVYDANTPPRVSTESNWVEQ